MVFVFALALVGAIVITALFTLISDGSPSYYFGVFVLMFSVYFFPSIVFYYLMGAIL